MVRAKTEEEISAQYARYREFQAVLEELRATFDGMADELGHILQSPSWDEPYKVFERSTLEVKDFEALVPEAHKLERALNRALAKKEW